MNKAHYNIESLLNFNFDICTVIMLKEKGIEHLNQLKKWLQVSASLQLQGLNLLPLTSSWSGNILLYKRMDILHRNFLDFWSIPSI